jgi:hypothetical protein
VQYSERVRFGSSTSETGLLVSEARRDKSATLHWLTDKNIARLAGALSSGR